MDDDKSVTLWLLTLIAFTCKNTNVPRIEKYFTGSGIAKLDTLLTYCYYHSDCDGYCYRCWSCVAKKHHKLGPDVKLQVYDQFSVPDEDEPKSSTQPETPAPTPFDVKDEPSVSPSPISRKMSHVMAHYVQNSNPPLTKLLDKFHVTVNIDIDDESEVGFILILTSVGSEKVKNWNEECEAMIKTHSSELWG